MDAIAMNKTAQKELIQDLREVERAATALIAANERLASRGQHDAKFTAIPGGMTYLANWRRWVKDNLHADW